MSIGKGNNTMKIQIKYMYMECQMNDLYKALRTWNTGKKIHINIGTVW